METLHPLADRLADLPGLIREQSEANAANARLIAAAPALYEALEHILNGALSLPRFAEEQAQAALKQARGEQ